MSRVANSLLPLESGVVMASAGFIAQQMGFAFRCIMTCPLEEHDNRRARKGSTKPRDEATS